VGPRGSHRLASSPPRPLAPSRGVGSFPSRHQAAIGRYALLRCGEVSFGRPARLRRRHKPGDGLKRVFKNECPACSSAAPVAAPGGKVAKRGAGVIIYGRHVLARRVSRAGAQFESRIVLLHLRNACPSRFWKTSGVLLRPPLSARHSAPGSRVAASDASCAPYGPRTRARRPRGAMLAISGFQSTAPLPGRRGEQ